MYVTRTAALPVLAEEQPALTVWEQCLKPVELRARLE
jgi:hypothetical protein